MIEASTIFLNPPMQVLAHTPYKPMATLAIPYLVGAMQIAHPGLRIASYDAAVGNYEDDLQDTFFSPTEIREGVYRIGVSNKRIMNIIADYDTVAITSTFSNQRSIILSLINDIRASFENKKQIIVGGIDVRANPYVYLTAGADKCCVTNAEEYFSINKYVPDYGQLPWDRYWEIARPHGGHFKKGEKVRYLPIITSTGCRYACKYCHVYEDKARGFGFYKENDFLEMLELLIVLHGTYNNNWFFIEDDCFLNKRDRAIKLMTFINGLGCGIANFNGLNVSNMFINGRVDTELLDVFCGVGMKEIVVAFESGSQRILNKYASGKWLINSMDSNALVRECIRRGIRMAGNYMVGFPDETKEEIWKTIRLAEGHADIGASVNLFSVIPLPGTPIYDDLIKSGKKIDTDNLNWTRGNIDTPDYSSEQIEEIRNVQWERLNKKQHAEYKKDMVI